MMDWLWLTYELFLEAIRGKPPNNPKKFIPIPFI